MHAVANNALTWDNTETVGSKICFTSPAMKRAIKAHMARRLHTGGDKVASLILILAAAAAMYQYVS